MDVSSRIVKCSNENGKNVLVYLDAEGQEVATSLIKYKENYSSF